MRNILSVTHFIQLFPALDTVCPLCTQISLPLYVASYLSPSYLEQTLQLLPPQPALPLRRVQGSQIILNQ